jgi:exopolyphosphatase / guanosine-5'-triphosphate,3'-diphosphate pyrophosphatase
LHAGVITMKSADVVRPASQTASTVAAVDIGSNTVRMLIAQVSAGGQLEVLEQLHRSVRLGQDTFRRGRLSTATMRSAVSVLRDYRRLIDFYQAGKVRVVATSAVREAANADTLVDRVFMATGLNVEVISTSEESRLTVAAVLNVNGETLSSEHRHVLVTEVGGGSTLLAMLHGGQIVSSASMQLGAIRLLESFATESGNAEHWVAALRQQVANTIHANKATMPLERVRTCIAVGSVARFLARELGQPTPSLDLLAVSRDSLSKLVAACEQKSAEELARRYGMSLPEAEALRPALLIHEELLQATDAERLLISQVSMPDGLLLDVAHVGAGADDEAIEEGVLHSAESLAEKYQADLAHARRVAELAVRLFDALEAEHGLGARHRMLLQVASLVHDIGVFVSSRGHHKHSYYLISNSEIFGLAPDELQIIAHLARYHRRSPPRPTHVEFMNLPPNRRMAVTKLAALLRVADALDRSHTQQVSDIDVELRREECVLHVRSSGDLTLERLAVTAKGDMFEDYYGLKVRLEESGHKRS